MDEMPIDLTVSQALNWLMFRAIESLDVNPIEYDAKYGVAEYIRSELPKEAAENGIALRPKELFDELLSKLNLAPWKQVLTLEEATDALLSSLRLGELASVRSPGNGQPAREMNPLEFVDTSISYYEHGAEIFVKKTLSPILSVLISSRSLQKLAPATSVVPSFPLGRPPNGDWNEYYKAVIDRCKTDGVPPNSENQEGWRTQADVEHFLLDLHLKEGYLEASTSTYRRHANAALKAVRQEIDC